MIYTKLVSILIFFVCFDLTWSTTNTSYDPFLKSKWDDAFDTYFDLNHNQHFDWNDFEIYLQKIAAVVKDAHDLEHATTLMHHAWHDLLVDFEKHGHLTEIEHNQTVSKENWDEYFSMRSPKNLSSWDSILAKFLFQYSDKNGDHVMDKNEYVGFGKVFGMNQTAAEQAFDKFAVDGNGQPLTGVNEEQVKKLWNEYFTATDPNAPGNYFFKPIPRNK